MFLFNKNKKPMDPKKQFSKWLARYGAWVWGIYLFIVAALIYYRPEAALPCVYLVIIITVNKMMDTWAYTMNSTYEKGLLAALDKAKIDLSLKGSAVNSASGQVNNSSSTQEASTETDEESENG